MRDMHLQLQLIADEYRSAQARLHELVRALPAEQWPRRADSARWSVAECVSCRRAWPRLSCSSRNSIACRQRSSIVWRRRTACRLLRCGSRRPSTRACATTCTRALRFCRGTSIGTCGKRSECGGRRTTPLAVCASELAARRLPVNGRAEPLPRRLDAQKCAENPNAQRPGTLGANPAWIGDSSVCQCSTPRTPPTIIPH